MKVEYPYKKTYYSSCVDSCTNYFKSDFIFSCNYNIFILTFVTWWISIWTKLHISWNGLKIKINEKMKKLLRNWPTWWEMKHDRGPISANIPTLFNCVTTASSTSPLNGRKTIALYFTGYTTKPCPGCIIPAPISSIVVTAITNPYFPVQVPSTSVYSFCRTVSSSEGPKYRGWSRISCSKLI